MTQMQSIHRWTRYHSFVIFTTFIISIVAGTAVPLTLAGLLSFAYFIAQHQTVERPQGNLSFWAMPPNWITLLRLLGTVIVGLIHPLLSPILLGGYGLLILIYDKVDGYLAQKHDMSSPFGAQLDQEADAFYISIFSLILYLQGYVAIWVLALGLLRYLNIIALVLLKQQHKKEPRFLLSRLVATMVMIALLIPFVLPAWLYTPFVALSVICLVLSFANTFTAHIRQPDPQPELGDA